MKEKLVGVKFGRLTVIAISHKDKNRHYHYICQCDCGKETVVRGYSLIQGRTQSCGCIRVESITRITKDVNTTHGLSNTPEYEVWMGIIKRTERPSSREAPFYKEKGIRMCEEWRSDIHSFIAYIRSIGYRPGLQCHRIDNNRGYEPGNLQFISAKEHITLHNKTRKRG